MYYSASGGGGACSVGVVLSYSAGYLGKEALRVAVELCYQLLFPSNVPDDYILGKECTPAIHALAFVP